MSPATAPMMSEAAIPPAQASVGITVAQCLVWAYTAVAAAPSATLTTPPSSPSRTASERNWMRMWAGHVPHLGTLPTKLGGL
jgi:hypothetical protein